VVVLLIIGVLTTPGPVFPALILTKIEFFVYRAKFKFHKMLSDLFVLLCCRIFNYPVAEVVS